MSCSFPWRWSFSGDLHRIPARRGRFRRGSSDEDRDTRTRRTRGESSSESPSFFFFPDNEVGVFYSTLSYGVEIFVEIKVNIELEK